MRNEKYSPENWRSEVPTPLCSAHPEYLELYWKAWELVYDHIVDLPGMPQTPYMDEAFCDSDIWIWDTCFMSLFCKYAQKQFPGVESLNNFYEVLYGDKSLPVIITRNAPEWTGEIIGRPARIRIHLLDNPPLFSWAEYENSLFSGNRDHLHELLEEHRYLQKHFQFLESLSGRYSSPKLRAETWWRKHPLGYFWEGGRSGMDNTPRGRIGGRAIQERPNNPAMLWVDAIAQQGLAALSISRLAGIIGKDSMREHWENRYNDLKSRVNNHYWDDEDGFYYDIHAETREFLKVMTPASFWPVLAEMSSPGQVERMCEALTNPELLGGAVPGLSLARNDIDFCEDGHYWRGSLWVPTAYTVVKGIEKYGKFALAHDISCKILDHMSKTYRDFEPHTIWECYNPNLPQPAQSCDDPPTCVRKDFCGWSALAPISLFIENIIGIHSVDAFKKEIKWSLPPVPAGTLGLRNLRFGDITTSLVYCDGEITVESTSPYRLWIDGQLHEIPSGMTKIPFLR